MKRRKVKVYAPGYKKGGQSFEPHMMFDPETGKAYKANVPADHERMAKMGYLHKDEMSNKKAFTKKLMVGGTSTARQNANIDEYGSDRLNMFKKYMSNNAVNQITQEEGNAFANEIMRPRQQQGMPMMFAGGEDPIKTINDKQAILSQYPGASINASGNAVDVNGNIIAKNIRPEFHTTGKYTMGADPATFSSSAGTPVMLRDGTFMPIGAVEQQVYGGTQMFNQGGFNGVNQDNLALMQQYADMYKGQQTGFKDTLGQIQGSVNMLTKNYDPTKVVKSKTKITKEFKPAWKQAVKDWRKSGLDESQFRFDPNNPYQSYDYENLPTVEYGGTYMMNPEDASMYMEELPEFNDGGVTAIRKSIAEKLRKGIGTKDFTAAEKNRFSLDTSDYGTKKNRYRGIKYDGIPLEKYVKVNRDIRSGNFNPKVDYVNITPPKQQKGIGPNAGEGEAPGRGPVTDAQLKKEYSDLASFDPFARNNAINKIMKENPDLQTQADLSMADQDIQQAMPPDRTPWWQRTTQEKAEEELAEKEEAEKEEVVKEPVKQKTTKKTKEASDIVEEVEKTKPETVEEETTTETTAETDPEGNVNYDEEFPEETTVDDTNKDVTSVTDPGYKIPGTNVPWNVQDTYLDMYKHRGKGLFRPEKTKMKFSHYANGLPAGQASSPAAVNEMNQANTLDNIIASETKGLDRKSARNVARNIRRAARDGQLDAYTQSNSNIGSDSAMTRNEMPAEGNRGTTFQDMDSQIRGNERPGTISSIPLRTPEGMTEQQMNAQIRGNNPDQMPLSNSNMTEEQMNAQMRGLDPADAVGPNSGLDMSRYAPAVSDDYDEASFMAEFEDADGNLDMKALRKEGFKKKDIKAYLDAKKQFEDNVALTGDDAFAKGQLSRAAKEAFESKNNRGLSKEEIAARDEQAFQDKRVQGSRARLEGVKKQEKDNRAADDKLEAELIEERRIKQQEAERLEAEQRAADPNSGAPAYGSVRAMNQKPAITGNDPNYDYVAARGFDLNNLQSAGSMGFTPSAPELGSNNSKAVVSNDPVPTDPMSGPTNNEPWYGSQAAFAQKPVIVSPTQARVNPYMMANPVARVNPVVNPNPQNEYIDTENLTPVQKQNFMLYGTPEGMGYGGVPQFEPGGAYYNIGGPIVDSSDPNSSTYIENEDELAALIPEAENFDETLPPPPVPMSGPTGPKFADTTVTEKDQYFGGTKKFLAAMYPGAGAAAEALGNKITQPKLMPKLNQMTSADYNFTADQNYADARGTISVNPSGVSMPISAPVQFTGGAGAQYGGERGMSFQEGGTYMLSDREIQQVLAAGGKIEII